MSNKPLFPEQFKGIAVFTPGGDLIYGIDPSKQSHWHIHLCAGLQEIFGLPEPPHFLVPGYTATIDRWLDPRTKQLRTLAEIYRPVQHHQALLNAVFGTGNLVWQVAPWQEESCDPIVLETYRYQFPQLWENHDLIVRFERTEQFSHSLEEGYPNLSLGQWKTLQGTEMPSRREGVLYSLGTPTPLENASFYGAASLTQPGYDNPFGEHPMLNANTEDFANKDISQGSIREPPDLHPDSLTASRSTSEGIDAHSQRSPTQGYVLRLFVSGHNAATEQILKSLHQLLEHSLGHPYTLKVIDVFNHPDQAEANQISATPTLLRVWPLPVRRIVGDLNNFEKVLRILAAPEA